MRGGFLAVLACTLWAAAPAQAHDRSVSYSTWTLDERGAEVEFAIDTREFTRLGDWTLPAPERDRRIGKLLSDSLTARRGGDACPVDSPPLQAAAAPGRTVFRWRVDCLTPGVFEVRSRLFDTLVTAHLHFARVSDGAGNVQEELLGAEAPALRFLGDRQRQSGFASALVRAFAAGLHCIAASGDHVLFVLGLVLLAASTGELARLFIAFAVAQSLTLALAILGWLAPNGMAVDSLLGLSVAVLAIDRLSARGGRGSAVVTLGVLVVPALAAAFLGYSRVPAPALAGAGMFAACYFLFSGATQPAADSTSGRRRQTSPGLRWLVAFVFGLLHGLGIAGTLADLRPAADPLAAALLGFNLGATTSQLALAAAAWSLAAAARTCVSTRLRIGLVEAASVLLLAAGSGWFFARTYF